MQAPIQEAAKRLVHDYGLTEDGDYYRKGRCPSCDRKELYARKESPWVIRCGRLNNCSWEGHIKDLYPDCFTNFNERYKPSRENKTATADAYLSQARGFKLAKIRGWYTQGSWHHPDADKGTATVRFKVAEDVYYERFVETVWVSDKGRRESRKARFDGEFKGYAWQPPGQTLEEGDELWITEGIFDAIALWFAGRKVAAALTCNVYPTKLLDALADKNIAIIWALDGDRAGREWTKKHHDRALAAGLKSSAAQIPQGSEKRDWNDLHQRNELAPSDLDKYRYYGNLIIAESPAAKALLMYNRNGWQSFSFDFGNRLFWFHMNLEKYAKAVDQITESQEDNTENPLTKDEIRDQALRQCNSISEIANCNFKFLYFQCNAVTDESWYYCRVSFPHSARPVKNTFTGPQLSSAGEFKKRLLSIAAGSVFTGEGRHLDQVIKHQLFNIKTVETIDFLGYSKEHNAYLFNDQAISAGRTYDINDEDYFEIGRKSVKTLSQSPMLHLPKDRSQYHTRWANNIYQCFGLDGIVALAFWMGSLFAEQIREQQKSFPFLEVVGEPGAGKSTLIEFLWKLFGRTDYEGFDPSKSTLAARARNMSQVSNLPVVLIEGDRDEDKVKHGRFDWDELKTAYNGRSVRSRGAKNNGNETYEPPFRGTIVISQNASVSASEAIIQRIVHLHFTRGQHDANTKVLAEQLEKMPVEEVSRFLVEATLLEKKILAQVAELAPKFESQILLLPEVRNVRIAKNHGQICALVSALQLLVPMQEETLSQAIRHIEQMAIARQKAISQDHPVVQDFWETFEYLGKEQLNHSKSPDYIAINLNHYAEEAMNKRQQIPPLSEIKRHLKTSRHRKFVDQKTVNSAIFTGGMDGKSVRCWIFQAGEHEL